MEELDRGIVVLPGFVGRDAGGATTLLGRGGSDLSALFVAAELGGRCVLLKDVGGLYDADPAACAGGEDGGVTARRYAALGWESARAVAGGAVQDKALRFAAARGLGFTVCGPGAVGGTRVGPGADRFAAAGPAHEVRPLRVALLGCGTVGGGVLRHLLDRPERYAVAGVAVRDLRRERPGVPRELLTDAASLLDRPADVLVEAAGGLAVEHWVEEALWRGRHVVTANKALLAVRGEALGEVARARGVRLLGSAAVGGALPALETVARLAHRPGIRALRGVLNGTSTFVLDRLAGGEPLESALEEARRRGFAEADSRVDLDGTDAAQKLALLVREAFAALPGPVIDRRGIDVGSVGRARGGGVWRLVAHAERMGRRVAASVRPQRLAADDFLARTEEAGNALEILLDGGGVVRLLAQGAGRWATAEAVLADLEDLRLGPDGAAGAEADTAIGAARPGIAVDAVGTAGAASEAEGSLARAAAPEVDRARPAGLWARVEPVEGVEP
jgi:homoserine dehydrogenase